MQACLTARMARANTAAEVSARRRTRGLASGPQRQVHHAMCADALFPAVQQLAALGEPARLVTAMQQRSGVQRTSVSHVRVHALTYYQRNSQVSSIGQHASVRNTADVLGPPQRV